MKQKLRRVLLVDDHEPTNFLNDKYLRQAGCAEKIDVAQNGQAALNFITAPDFPRPELIILDINMPVMDGWEFLERYRSLDKSVRGEAAILMLTTSRNPDDEQRARALGLISEFAIKPLTPGMLDGILQKFFSNGVENNSEN